MDKTNDIVSYAKEFAKEKHKNQKRKDGITPYYDHLEGVVNRLKNIGIADRNVLCAAWLHDIIENTDVIFDQVNEMFGREVAVLVLALTKESNIPRKERESRYVNQLKSASFEAKIIKLCDISSNLKDIINAPLSKTQKIKQSKKMFHYLRVIKNDILEKKSEYPKIQEMIDGINIIGIKFNQNPI